jgi:hypothetical protein
LIALKSVEHYRHCTLRRHGRSSHGLDYSVSPLLRRYSLLFVGPNVSHATGFIDAACCRLPHYTLCRSVPFPGH